MSLGSSPARTDKKKNTAIKIREKLASGDIKAANTSIIYCTDKTQANEIFQVVFSQLNLKPIPLEKLQPQLFLSFLKNLFLGPEIDIFTYANLVSKLIAVSNSHLSSHHPDYEKTELYQKMIFMIISNPRFLDAIDNDCTYRFSLDYIHRLTLALRSMPQRNGPKNLNEVSARLEQRIVNIAIGTATSEDGRPILSRIKRSEVFRLIGYSQKLTECILENKNDLLYSLDHFQIYQYIFQTKNIKKEQKLTVLRTLFSGLEDEDPQKRERAKACLGYLMSGDKPTLFEAQTPQSGLQLQVAKDHSVLTLISDRLSGKLNIPGALLLAVHTVNAKAGSAKSTEEKVELMKAFFTPLARAMRKCKKAGTMKRVNDFFEEEPSYLAKLCEIYSLATDKETQEQWNDFWFYNENETLLQLCMTHLPMFWYDKAYEQAILAKANLKKYHQTKQKEFEDQHIVHTQLFEAHLEESRYLGCPYAALGLAVHFAVLNSFENAKEMFDEFIGSQQEYGSNSLINASTYAQLRELYLTVQKTQNNGLLMHIQETIESVYPGLMENLTQTNPPKNKAAKCVYHWAVADPTALRLHQLLDKHRITTKEDLMTSMQVLIAKLESLQLETCSKDNQEDTTADEPLEQRAVLRFVEPTLCSSARSVQPIRPTSPAANLLTTDADDSHPLDDTTMELMTILRPGSPNICEQEPLGRPSSPILFDKK
ncbi:MAG: hypothetical protein AB7V32_01085 [Candidatus Berkiella sp.]